MKQLELYGRVRYAVLIEGMSRREAARVFGVDRRTVDKMLAFSAPPGYRRKKTPARPKLDPYVGIIDRILEDDRTRIFSPLLYQLSYLGMALRSQGVPKPLLFRTWS